MANLYPTALIVMAFLAEVGCRSGDCALIVDHTFDVAVAERAAGMNAAEVAVIKEQMTARRKTAIEQCRVRKPSTAVEECALAADTLDAIATCQ